MFSIWSATKFNWWLHRGENNVWYDCNWCDIHNEEIFLWKLYVKLIIILIEKVVNFVDCGPFNSCYSHSFTLCLSLHRSILEMRKLWIAFSSTPFLYVDCTTFIAFYIASIRSHTWVCVACMQIDRWTQRESVRIVYYFREEKTKHFWNRCILSFYSKHCSVAPCD